MSKIWPEINKIEMFSELFYEHRIPEVYGAFSYANKEFIANENTGLNGNAVCSIRLIPNYLKLKLSHVLLNKRTIRQVHKGYAIDLKQVADAEKYVKQQFGSNAKTIRRYVNRLEACFPITYSMFYGEMDYETYVFIMSSLRQMLVKRFEQRNTTNSELQIWDEVVESTYVQILEKKASLFVIFNGTTPIEISLNYHFDQILFSSTSSYDIDYSKFGLGHVEIYKQIEWCLNHNIAIFEMGDGELDYKRRWSNHIYHFEHHVIFPKGSILKAAIAYLEVVKVRVREYLKSKDISIRGYKIRYNRTVKTDNPLDKQIVASGSVYTVIPIENSSETPKGRRIDYTDNAYLFFKKMVCDFLYTHMEHVNNVEVLEIERYKMYVIQGKENTCKIVFNSAYNPKIEQ